MARSAWDRFAAKLSPPNERGCRLWNGSTHRLGYGHFKLNGKTVIASRVAFFFANSRWPSGHAIHECDTPNCCEAAHIHDGTVLENMRDCAAKGRNRSPRPGNGHTKLLPETRAIIVSRFMAGEHNKSALAREYGVTPTRIRQVING